VREPFDLFRKQGDPQPSRDKTNYGGFSVSVLQNSWGETRFAARINQPLVRAKRKHAMPMVDLIKGMDFGVGVDLSGQIFGDAVL
jgi:hypothetical protein